MPKLSEVATAQAGDEAAKRVQSEMGTVADVTPPPASVGRKKAGKLGKLVG